LTAESAGRDQGATFTLRLKLHAPTQDAAQGVGAAGDDQDHGWRVLLVEDNPDAAETIVMCLETYGWHVTHAATCAAALRTAAEGEFDVVLTDLGLPDGSGIDVGRQLSARMPVVALSGYGAPPDLKQSAMAGFSGHLTKPADPQTVHAALLKAVEGR